MKKTIALITTAILFMLVACSNNDDISEFQETRRNRNENQFEERNEHNAISEYGSEYAQGILPLIIKNNTVIVGLSTYAQWMVGVMGIYFVDEKSDVWVHNVGVLESEVIFDETPTFIMSDVRSIEAAHTQSNKRHCTIFLIKNDNSLWGYGSNKDGVLGDGTGVDQENPVKILDNVAYIGEVKEGEQNITSIYAIKTDRTLWIWGDGKNYSPVMVAEDVVAVSSVLENNFYNSYVYIMLIKTTGGQITYFNDLQSSYIPYYNAPPEPVYDIQYFEDKSKKYCWLNSDNTLYFNDGGLTYELDQDSQTYNAKYKYDPQMIAANVSKFKCRFLINYDKVSVHFIKNDGTLWGYGANERGQLGDGTKIPERNEPVKIADDVVEVYDYAFLKSNGEIWTWDETKPTPQNMGGNNINACQDTNRYCYRVTSDGEVYYSYQNSVAGLFGQYATVIENVKIPKTVTFP